MESMIRLKQVSGSKEFDQNEQFILSQNERYESTKTGIKNGHWYYEATTYSGNGFSIFGYMTNEGLVAFYPFGTLDTPYVLLQDNMRTDQSTEFQQIIKLNFPVEYPYTVGVGIDIDKSSFTVKYQNYTQTEYYNQNTQIISVNTHIWSSSSSAAYEKVSINFGFFHLSYSFRGFVSWQPRSPFAITFIFAQDKSFLLLIGSWFYVE